MTARARWRAGLPLVLLGALVGCDGSSVGPPARPPDVVSAVVAADGGPLLRSITVGLEHPGGVVVDYWADGTPVLRVSGDGEAEAHGLLLPRLRADHAYAFEVRSIGAGGVLGEAVAGTFTTGSLPPDLAKMTMSTVGVPTSPLTMMEAVSRELPHLPFVVDREGYVVWYRESPGGSTGFTRLDDGSFVFNAAGGLWVVDLENEVLAHLDRAVVAARAGVDSFRIHHDVIRTPSNTVLMLVQDTGRVADTVWTGEAIWEWDPSTDLLLKRWASKDFLDPSRDRGPRSTPSDWLHANSLGIGPRGNVVVSLFWLHEVLSIAPDFRSIEWRLGGPASSFVVEDDAMEAGQHTALEVAPNRVLMFDNGRDRSAGLFSRGLEMLLDPDGGTARIAWEFRPEPDIYAPIVSSARRLSNGNTVVGFGTPAGLEGSTGPIAVYEVTPSGRVVWKLEVVSGVPLTYRATPMTSLGGEVEVGEPASRPQSL